MRRRHPLDDKNRSRFRSQGLILMQRYYAAPCIASVSGQISI